MKALRFHGPHDLRLEDEFGIEISDDGGNGIETVQDAVDYVERRSA